MKHSLMRCLVAFAILFTVRILSAEPLVVADRTCLFLDDHYIDEQKGLSRTFHQGKPHPKAIIAEDNPWERWICLYGACFYDPVAKVYRMYYQTSHSPSGVPGVSLRQDVCYAESKDAITWTRPKLGMVDFKGSKENNILFFCAGPANVFIDPKATDPKGRLKANVYFLTKDAKYKDAHGMHLLQSADGIEWEHYASNFHPPYAKPEEGGFNDSMIIGWDPLKNKYIGYTRAYSTHSIGEIPSADGKTKKVRRRGVGITWSDDLSKGWSPIELIIAADERDDKHVERRSKDPEKPDWAEIYGVPYMIYGNHYLGFMTMFELADGKDFNGGGGLQFAFSNDGHKWSRPEPRQNAIENSDDPELFPNFGQYNAPLDMGDETWIFYSENNGTHGMPTFAQSRGRIRAAVWRKDGFISLDSPARGTLITKPIVAGGEELVINYKTDAGGSVRVGLLDESGAPISQFNLGECQEMTGDATAKKAVWVGGSNFGGKVEKGKPVRLMFELDKAQLYSFRFQK